MATKYLTLSTKVNPTGRQEILIRFSHGRINQRAKTNIFINSESWDYSKGEIKNVRILTKEIKKAKADLADLEASIEKSWETIDKEKVASDWLVATIDKHNFPEKYTPKIEPSKEQTLFELVETFIADAPNRHYNGRKLSPQSIKKYPSTFFHLKQYAKSIKKIDFDVAEINCSFYEGFVAYLQKQGLTMNTVGSKIRVLKTIINAAKIEIKDYNEYKVFREEVDNIYLTETELQQLKEVVLSPYLDRVRDCFLLLAWTGCRYSDLEKIGKTDIKDGFISFRQQKTNNKVVIPLHPVVAEVLEKYDYTLPEAITNQKFNEYIKEACKCAEINSTETLTRTIGGIRKTETFEKWQLVTSHTGRRSFATNMYKRGLPSITIMAITGHRTEKAFLSYIKITPEEHAEMMKKAWENIYNHNNQ
jgi:integrase